MGRREGQAAIPGALIAPGNATRPAHAGLVVSGWRAWWRDGGQEKRCPPYGHRRPVGRIALHRSAVRAARRAHGRNGGQENVVRPTGPNRRADRAPPIRRARRKARPRARWRTRTTLSALRPAAAP